MSEESKLCARHEAESNPPGCISCHWEQIDVGRIAQNAKDERQERLDSFARAALTGLLASVDRAKFDDFAADAWKLADAMEAERAKRLAPEGPKP